MTPVSFRLFFHQLTYSVMFFLLKTFVKCPSLSLNGIYDDVRYDIIST